MGKIEKWTESITRNVVIAVSGTDDVPWYVEGVTVRPDVVEIKFTQSRELGDDGEERVWKIIVRGMLIGGRNTREIGSRTWYPNGGTPVSELPEWIQELIFVYSIHADLTDQTRAIELTRKWLS